MAYPRPNVRRVPLEVAVFSGQAALQAQLLGASRVELNRPGSYALGGLTPPIEELARVTARLTIPVHVMIRVRSDPTHGRPDFVCTEEDLDEMLIDITGFKAAGLMNLQRGDRFVLGVLEKIQIDDDDGSDRGDGTGAIRDRFDIDKAACEALVQRAKPFGCVFHRAFDSIAASSPLHCALAIERLDWLDFDAILTAGGSAGSCCDNLDALDYLCYRVAGRLTIIVGGGLRSHNVARAAAQLAAHAVPHADIHHSPIWFHTAAVKTVDGLPTEDLDLDELHALLKQLGHIEPT